MLKQIKEKITKIVTEEKLKLTAQYLSIEFV